MLSAIGSRGGPIAAGFDRNNGTVSMHPSFECHPGGQPHGTLVLGLASAGVIANLSLAGLIIARKSLRRWSSGLLLHGTVVDGCRAALLIPLGRSIFNCWPVTRCSLVDTGFLVLTTVTSLNLLTASLSDAPLLPPPVLVPKLLQSAGFGRSKQDSSANLYPQQGSSLGTKGPSSYYSDFYEDDANLLAESTAMPDSPECVLFGAFMVWFAALTINLGPTFLSGALAAQAEIIPNVPSCPLVRGPTRHIVLNILWASVNLLCVVLATAHLRKLKKDLARARLGLLAAAGAGLAGLAGITTAQLESRRTGMGDVVRASSSADLRTPAELDKILRDAQKNGRRHIRTLGTLAFANLACWLPLYICVLIAPLRRDSSEDAAPVVYEITLLVAFSHSIFHPLLLLALHEPLREALRQILVEWFCCFCLWLGVLEVHDKNHPKESGTGGSATTFMEQHPDDIIEQRPHFINVAPTEQEIITAASRSHSQHSLHRLSHAASLDRMGNSSNTNMDRERMASSSGCLLIDDMIPPPPPPVNNLRKQQQKSLEMEESGLVERTLRHSQTSLRNLENRW